MYTYAIKLCKKTASTHRQESRGQVGEYYQIVRSQNKAIGKLQTLGI